MSDASVSDMSASDSENESADDGSDDDFDVHQNAEDDEEDPVVLSQAQIKARNVRDMLSGSLTVARTAMVSGLKCQNAAAVLAQPFKAPFAGATAGTSAELARRLANRRKFVPWGSSVNIATAGRASFVAPLLASAHTNEAEEALPPGIEPLVLWEDNPKNVEGTDTKLLPPITVDNMLCKWLRPHQREVSFFVFYPVKSCSPCTA